MYWVPFEPTLPETAWLNRNEGWEALNIVSCCCTSVLRAIDFDKYNLVFPVVFSELLDNSVPIVLKLFAIEAFGHKEVNNDELVTALIIQELLQLSWSMGLGPQGLLPPGLTHSQEDAALIF